MSYLKEEKKKIREEKKQIREDSKEFWRIKELKKEFAKELEAMDENERRRTLEDLRTILRLTRAEIKDIEEKLKSLESKSFEGEKYLGEAVTETVLFCGLAGGIFGMMISGAVSEEHLIGGLIGSASAVFAGLFTTLIVDKGDLVNATLSKKIHDIKVKLTERKLERLQQKEKDGEIKEELAEDFISKL